MRTTTNFTYPSEPPNLFYCVTLVLVLLGTGAESKRNFYDPKLGNADVSATFGARPPRPRELPRPRSDPR